LIIPVLVMASGQLAGGLAWLAISGEDAPDLVATAPVTPARLIRAKVEAVLNAIMIVVMPFVFAFALVSTWHALVLAAGAAVAAISATMIQLWFRAQARRAQFHRRQTSSRIATFAEAFSSVGWAGTAALYAAGAEIVGTIAAVLTLLTLTVTYFAAPKTPR
jgi:ABC-2 type transport system permease protein